MPKISGNEEVSVKENTNHRKSNGKNSKTPEKGLLEKIRQLEARNAKLENILKKKKQEASGKEDEKPHKLKPIPRPAGGVSTWKGVQEKMRLIGSQEKRDMYEAILKKIHVAYTKAGIDEAQKWSQVPATKKAEVYAVLRNEVTRLECYKGDWASEFLTYQYHVNDHKNLMQTNHLEVPEGKAHLKENSSKRSNKPRGNEHRTASAAFKRKAHEEAKKDKEFKKRRLYKKRASDDDNNNDNDANVSAAASVAGGNDEGSDED